MGEAVTTIRANCPSCGDVQLTADDLTVRVCADNTGPFDAPPAALRKLRTVEADVKVM